MRSNTVSRISATLALATALLASPALAQGKGKGKEKKERAPAHAVESRRESRERPELRRRDDRREVYDRRDDREREEIYSRTGRRDGRRVPPGWCRGKGNPHNTPENCGPGARREGWYGDREGDWSRNGSYEQGHTEFHRWHDRECRMRAAERPFDIGWQIRVRRECKERHDDWHRRAGRRHDY